MFFVLQNLKKSLERLSIGTTPTSLNQETLKNINILIPQKVLEKFNIIIKTSIIKSAIIYLVFKL